MRADTMIAIEAEARDRAAASRDEQARLRARIAELERALHEINRWNDHPARYSEPLQRILNDVIDTSDVKFEKVK